MSGVRPSHVWQKVAATFADPNFKPIRREPRQAEDADSWGRLSTEPDPGVCFDAKVSTPEWGDMHMVI